MTDTEIREAFADVSASVEVPAVDQVAFQRLVTAERRRRTAGGVLAGVAAAVVLGAGVGVAIQLGGESEPGPAGTTEERAGLEPMTEPIPFLRDGVLQVLLRDGDTVDAGGAVEEVLGLTERGIVVVSNDSRLLLMPLGADGHPGRGRPVFTDRPVDRVWLSKDRTRIGWVDIDNVLHLREIGDEQDYWTGRPLSQQTQLMALDGTHWIEDEGDRLSLRYPDETFEVRPAIDPVGAELAGATLAVRSVEGVEIFSAVDGSPVVPGGIGGNEGALSPDGAWYAAGYDTSAVDQGVSQILEVIDTDDGSMESITRVDYDGVIDISWTGPNFLALITHQGKNSVLECSAEALSCEVLIAPTTATLALPSS